MANETTLRLVFKDASDRNKSLTYGLVKDNPAPSDVKDLMTAIVANGSIFEIAPASIVGAELITKNVTDINVS